MLTPGGGGYGCPKGMMAGGDGEEKHHQEFLERGSVFEYRQAQESV